MGAGVRQIGALHRQPAETPFVSAGWSDVCVACILIDTNGFRVATSLRDYLHHHRISVGAEEADCRCCRSCYRTCPMPVMGSNFIVNGSNLMSWRGFVAGSSVSKPGRRRANVARCVGQVDPVVHAPARTADLHLRMGRRKAVEPHFAHIRHVVPVCILQKHDFRLSVPPVTTHQRHQKLWQNVQFVSKDGPLVGDPVRRFHPPAARSLTSGAASFVFCVVGFPERTDWDNQQYSTTNMRP